MDDLELAGLSSPGGLWVWKMGAHLMRERWGGRALPRSWTPRAGNTGQAARPAQPARAGWAGQAARAAWVAKAQQARPGQAGQAVSRSEPRPALSSGEDGMQAVSRKIQHPPGPRGVEGIAWSNQIKLSWPGFLLLPLTCPMALSQTCYTLLCFHSIFPWPNTNQLQVPVQKVVAGHGGCDSESQESRLLSPWWAWVTLGKPVLLLYPANRELPCSLALCVSSIFK